MLEVCFSEATKYSMQSAKKKRSNLLTGNPKDIIFIGPHLDIGDISIQTNEIERQESLNQIINNGQLTQNKLEEMKDAQCTAIEKLVVAAKNGKTIRIWKSRAPFSACGFAFICHLLNNIPSNIRVISLPSDPVHTKNILVSYSHWGEVAPEDYPSFLADEKRLSDIEKMHQSVLWEELKLNNCLLRAVVNGQLLSVPEDFYDHLLCRSFPDEEFIIGEFLAEVLGKYPLGVSDSWYLYRLRKMIENNKLNVISSKNIVNPYQIILKDCS